MRSCSTRRALPMRMPSPATPCCLGCIVACCCIQPRLGTAKSCTQPFCLRVFGRRYCCRPAWVKTQGLLAVPCVGAKALRVPACLVFQTDATSAALPGPLMSCVSLQAQHQPALNSSTICMMPNVGLHAIRLTQEPQLGLMANSPTTPVLAIVCTLLRDRNRWKQSV